MFRCVVTLLDEGVVKVDEIGAGGKMLGNVLYPNIDSLSPQIVDKVKQLMWLKENDNVLVEGLGLRVGDSIFWIHESGE